MILQKGIRVSEAAANEPANQCGTLGILFVFSATAAISFCCWDTTSKDPLILDPRLDIESFDHSDHLGQMVQLPWPGGSAKFFPWCVQEDRSSRMDFMFFPTGEAKPTGLKRI